MVKRLSLFVLALALTAPSIPQKLSDGPGPIPICPPGKTCAIQGDIPLLPM